MIILNVQILKIKLIGQALFKNEKANSGELSIELQLQDKEHLKKFNKSIDGNLQVKERTRSNCFSGKYKDNVYTTCFIRVHSIKIVNDLIKLGCTPNKSATIGLPDLPECGISLEATSMVTAVQFIKITKPM